MKKKFLSLLLALAFVISLVPVALAEGSVAVVNGTEYGTLNEALYAASQAKTAAIKLLNDVSGTESQYIEIASDLDITLDLNGFELKGINEGPFIKNYGILTINDSSNGNGRIYTTNVNAQGRVAIANYGTLTINNGTFGDKNTDRSDANDVQRGNALRNYGTATINGGYFTACDNYTNSGYAYAIANGGSEYPNASMTIENATVYGSINGLIASDGGTLTVNGGTYTLGDGTETNLWRIGYTSGTGKLIVNNGTFTKNCGGTNRGFFGAEVIINGGTFEDKINTTIYFDSGNAKICGGNFKNDISKGSNVNLSVEGGTFVTDPTPYVPSSTHVVNNENGSYTIAARDSSNSEAKIGDTCYATLSDAISVANDGDTVTLLKDVTVSTRIKVEKNITLDLNGKTFKNDDHAVLWVANANVSVTGTGTISSNNAVKGVPAVWLGAGNKEATLTIGKDVTVSGSAEYGIAIFGIENATANLIINGKVTTTGAGAAVSGNGTYNPASITVNDGATISCTNGAGIFFPQAGTLTVNGGSITGAHGIQMFSGNLVITGNPSITATGADDRGNKGTGDGPIPDGAAVSVVNRGYPGGTPSVTIGGTPTLSARNNEQALCVYTWSNGAASDWAESKNQITITGGTYSTDPSAYVDTVHYSVTETDGKYVVSQITNTVTFQSNGGSAVDTQVVPFESTATRPADPTRSGFTFGGWYTNGALTTAYDFGASVTKDIILFAKWNSTAVDSGSDSGASSGGSTGGTETKPDDSGTTTVTNPDGSKTETTTNTTTNKDGSTTETKTETVTNTDGSKTETTTNTTTNKDGSTTETKVETVTNADGSKTETKSETKTDATGAKTSTETVKATDTTGSTGTTTTTTNAAGETTVTAEATVTDKAVTEAAKTGAAVTVPVEVPAATTTAAAAEVKISVPASAGSVAVEVPVTNTGVGVVAVIVKEDGTEEIVKTAVPTENGVALNVEGNATVKIVDNSKSFNDVKTTDWHDSAVTFVAAREIMDGVGGNNFAPNTVLSRGMIAKVLHNFENNPATTAENLFNDVDDNTWYTDAVKWAAENKIVEGDGNNYAPNDNITREQLAAILYRYANVKGFDVTKTGDLGTYNDGANTSAWAQTAMEWAVANGILSGKGNNVLDPKGAASRAEVAQILMNFCTNVAQ